MEKAHRLAGLLAGISIVAFTTPAMAQITAAAGAPPPPLTVAQAAPAGGDQPASQEIVITGSRIAAREPSRGCLADAREAMAAQVAAKADRQRLAGGKATGRTADAAR